MPNRYYLHFPLGMPVERLKRRRLHLCTYKYHFQVPVEPSSAVTRHPDLPVQLIYTSSAQLAYLHARYHAPRTRKPGGLST